MREVLNFASEVFGGNFGQNKTCGNHIHLRFSSEVWKLFTFPTLWEGFIRKYKERFPGAKYSSRLRNRYCEAGYNPHVVCEQLLARGRSSSRYKAINFNSINLYNTVEVRIMPRAQGFHDFKQMLLFTIDTIEKVLETPFSYASPACPKRGTLLKEVKIICVRLSSAIRISRHGLI